MQTSQHKLWRIKTTAQPLHCQLALLLIRHRYLRAEAVVVSPHLQELLQNSTTAIFRHSSEQQKDRSPARRRPAPPCPRPGRGPGPPSARPARPSSRSTTGRSVIRLNSEHLRNDPPAPARPACSPRTSSTRPPASRCTARHKQHLSDHC